MQPSRRQRPRVARRARRRGPGRRTSALLLAAALVLSQLLGALGPAPTEARAADFGTVRITNVTNIEDWPDIDATFRNFHAFEVTGGGASDPYAYCAAKTMQTPSAGMTFSGGTTYGDARVDYLLYHGYSSTNTDGYGAGGPGKFYVATQYALWLALPDQGGSHAEVRDELTRTYRSVASAVEQMLAEADAYAARGGGGPEAGCAVFWPSPDGVNQSLLTCTNPTGGLELVKASTDPALTAESVCYGLEGATYKVYSDSDCTVEAATLVTDESGRASVSGLPRGTYYVVETTPARGFALDPQVHEVSVEGGVTARLDVSDVPQRAVGLVITKTDAQTGGTAQGDATLAGAEFTVRHYDGYYDSADALPEQPAHSWVVRTGEDGVARLDAEHLVSGDALVLTSDDRAAVPLGTLAIFESSAPEGYRLTDGSVRLRQVRPSGTGEVVSVELSEGFSDEVIRGGASVPKIDHELQEGVSQGDATLAGAVISVSNASAHAVVVGGASHAPGEEVMSVTTAEDGTASIPKDALPYGTYSLSEKSAPAGYLLNEGWSVTFSVQRDGSVADLSETPLEDEVARGGVAVTKLDYDLAAPTAQGDATLEGAVMSIVNRSDGPVLVGGVLYQPGDEVATITTDASGRAASAPDLLPYGTYELREKGAPAGYLVNADWTRTFEVREDGAVTSLDGSGFDDAVARGGVTLRKTDRELVRAEEGEGTQGTSLPLGSTTLAGARVELTNESAHPVQVGGTTFQPGEVVCTLVTDEAGACSTAADALPYGTYTARETVPPVGYLLNEDWERTFEVREDGVVIDLTSDEEAVDDQAIRGDVSFTKAEEGSQSRMAGVPFRVTSQTTGEWHLVVSDENGMVDTSASWASHEASTNANDGAVREDGTVDDAALDASAGVWFSGRTDAWTAPDDALGALPFDTYLIEELPCAANEGHRLVSTLVTVSRNAVTLDLGTMDDETIPTPTLTTELTHGGAKAAGATDGLTLTDSVRCEGLLHGTEYRVVDELHGVRERADGTLEDLGVIASAEKTFTARASMESLELELGDVDATGLAGCRLVAAARLYRAGELVASHDALDDEGQTVRVPALGTTLLSDATSGHDAPSYASSTLTDTVDLRNLPVGSACTVRGTLRIVELDETGRQVAGETIDTAETTFIATEQDMTVELSFDVDGRALAGRTVNAAEALELEGLTVAAHDDVTDEGQTVRLPAVETLARSQESGTQSSPDGAEQVLVDTVRLTNLLVGETYELRSSAHVREVREDGTTADGGILTDAQGNEARVTMEFVADEQDMELEVEIPFDASSLAGRDIVAFEELARDGVLLATHADVDDAAQTLHVPSVATQARHEPSGSQELPLGEAERVVDHVSVGNLVPGETYELLATVHRRGTGQAGDAIDLGVLADGSGGALEARVSFTADAESMEIEVPLTIDSRDLAGTDVVFFEELRQGELTLARHADIRDADQTLGVASPKEVSVTPQRVPGTGEAASMVAALALAGAAATGVGACLASRRRNGTKPKKPRG